VLVSRVRLGGRARGLGLFVTPEESEPAPEIVELEHLMAAARARDRELPAPERDGFVRAIVDPLVNALHRWTLRGPRSLSPSIREARKKLVERILATGPHAASARERRMLLLDVAALDELHRRVWALAEPDSARRWGRPGLSS